MPILNTKETECSEQCGPGQFTITETRKMNLIYDPTIIELTGIDKTGQNSLLTSLVAPCTGRDCRML